jgi:hypothetical protein
MHEDAAPVQTKMQIFPQAELRKQTVKVPTDAGAVPVERIDVDRSRVLLSAKDADDKTRR